MYCHNCGTQTDGNFCPNCGTPIKSDVNMGDSGVCSMCSNCSEQPSNRDWIATLLFCIFLGFIGIHRFYSGKTGTGILYIFTGGLFGIGVLVDLIMIVCGRFRDAQGRIISQSI